MTLQSATHSDALAVEELGHYREVIRLLVARGVTPGPDRKDNYVRALNDEIRRGPEFFLLDRLLVAAIVERRGNERFGLIAQRLPDAGFPGAAELAAFYRAITASEGRHWQLFLTLAAEHCPGMMLEDRLADLVERERVVTGRHRRVRGEDRAGADQLQRLFAIARFDHALGA